MRAWITDSCEASGAEKNVAAAAAVAHVRSFLSFFFRVTFSSCEECRAALESGRIAAPKGKKKKRNQKRNPNVKVLFSVVGTMLLLAN